jgi:hypothetical protein
MRADWFLRVFCKASAEDEAVGIPNRRQFGNIERLPTGRLLRYVVQAHDARRSGKHYDIRLGTPETGLYSWATKKELPPPGGKIMVFQQPLHRYNYGTFQGQLAGGYGAGTVKTHDNGSTIVQVATPDKIKFVITHRGAPEYFSLIRTNYGPKKPANAREAYSQGGSWLKIGRAHV